MALGLTKPIHAQVDWDVTMNANLDILDALADVQYRSSVLTFSATPEFNGQLRIGTIVFELTLTGNVTSSTAPNVVPGQTITFIIAQDGAGGHAFVWPTNVKNATTPSTDPNSVSIQSFIVRSDGNLYPTGVMTIS